MAANSDSIVIERRKVEEVSVLPDYDITCSKGGGDDAWLVVFDQTTVSIEPVPEGSVQLTVSALENRSPKYSVSSRLTIVHANILPDHLVCALIMAR